VVWMTCDCGASMVRRVDARGARLEEAVRSTAPLSFRRGFLPSKNAALEIAVTLDNHPKWLHFSDLVAVYFSRRLIPYYASDSARQNRQNFTADRSVGPPPVEKFPAYAASITSSRCALVRLGRERQLSRRVSPTRLADTPASPS
jgi:hypothetical protein